MSQKKVIQNFAPKKLLYSEYNDIVSKFNCGDIAFDTYLNKEALEDILEQYNEYCNEKKCNQENTSTLTIEDISNYFEGSAEKSEEIQAFLNANPNLY